MSAAHRVAVILLVMLFPLAALSACSRTPASIHQERVPGGKSGSYIVPTGIHKIKHVIIIEQENRSFDSYFGTYPGADGIPHEERGPNGVRAESENPGMHEAVSRLGRHQRRRAARRGATPLPM